VPMDVNLSGAVTLPSITVPMSEALSPYAQQFYASFLHMAPGNLVRNEDETWDDARNRWKGVWDLLVAQARGVFPVAIQRDVIAGVNVDVISPSGDAAAAAGTSRIVLFAHAGAFCNGQGAISEAIGLSSVANIKVISIDYSLAPESKFPTQINQILAVYQALLKQQKPESIALVGTSAGGQLMQMAVTRMISEDIPRPAALALFSAGLSQVLSPSGSRGDTGHYAAALEGYVFYGGATPTPLATDLTVFLGDVDPCSPSVAPLFSPEILAQFPPTVFLGGGRDETLSTVLCSHRALLAAGVPAELHVWEGLCHGWWLAAALPEAVDAFGTVRKFFDRYQR